MTSFCLIKRPATSFKSGNACGFDHTHMSDVQSKFYLYHFVTQVICLFLLQISDKIKIERVVPVFPRNSSVKTILVN